jgi:hypothetical protein
MVPALISSGAHPGSAKTAAQAATANRLNVWYPRQRNRICYFGSRRNKELALDQTRITTRPAPSPLNAAFIASR